MANFITGIRVVCGVLLLFCPVLSRSFYGLYLLGGFTDMIDGTVARKTGRESAFGARLDTGADFIFVAACLFKLLPSLAIPGWLWGWIAVIALIKISSVISGLVMWKKFVTVHSAMNRVTGAMLFAMPFTLSMVDLKYSGAVVCAVATFAAVQEGHLIRTGRGE